MAKIPFTKQELTRAWREAGKVADVTPRENPHRLLLFYAVECGLKAVYLKNMQLDVIDNQIATELAHDLNKIATLVRVRKDDLLPTGLAMKPCKINKSDFPRRCDVSQLNQIWRYGGKLSGDQGVDDNALEVKLISMNAWIKKELQ
ncbi:hypothetical protein [Yersinia kristensenii]|uniref:hypothetical protein n=1 Tax=Yersinia kristensenii TaxID=28152 RepID=UPI001C6086A8|nr:hypothetical protein [Yersinia kristensenii]MBW5826031.1 hypothetical protein [Yersinia kristensenii]